MKFFPSSRGFFLALLLLGQGLGSPAARAQTSTNVDAPIPDPTLLEGPTSAPRALPVENNAANAPLTPAIPSATNPPAPAAITPAPNSPPAESPAIAPTFSGPPPRALPVLSDPTGAGLVENGRFDSVSLPAALLVLTCLGGFVLYHCGLTRARNCAHTSTLVLVGAGLGLVGYWMGGFAVQTGGVGDAHAATPQTVGLAQQDVLDHELGFMAGGHHWGLMGNAGFFLETDRAARAGVATLFLAQAVLLAMTLAAALGASLERGRLLAMGVLAFLTGAAIYPLVANWIWGGGWLAEMGREFGLGHGVVDLAGAGVVHETAGALALAIALVLGPRHGRFERNKTTGIPGHNVPFMLLGALALVVALIASSASASSTDGLRGPDDELALANVLLGAVGGMLVAIFLGASRQQRSTPARLCRGLLGGAVSICGGSAFFDPWAAFLIGALAALLVEAVVGWLARRQIDDPANTTAVHGAAGAWGLLATGLFATGGGGRGLNEIDSPVRGLFFGGGWHQLAAQAIGCAVDFIVVFVLGFLALQVVQRILGNRVKLTEELQGLDWAQVGALGYQPDVESGEESTLP